MKADNRPFTQRQDELIRYLYNQQNIKNWGLVASTLSQKYNYTRNAKQCRDRYKQYIDPNMHLQWTQQQQMYLNKLHNSIGNKWALISQYFPGKTDNCLKNHFYSKLRKSMRFLNKIIKIKFKKEFKEIKIACIYKIIQGFQQKFKQKPYVSEQVSDHCANLKNILLAYSQRNQNQLNPINNYLQQKQVISMITQFNKNYKKKTKKQKRQSLQVSQLFKPVKGNTQKQLLNNIAQNQQNQSQFSEIDSNLSDKSSSKNSPEIKQNMKNQMNDRNQDQQDIRKSGRVFILVQDQQLRISNHSKLPIQYVPDDNVRSSYKMSDQQNKFTKDFLRWSGSNNQNMFPFGFLRGSSSFRSYQSQSNQSDISKVDMFDDNIRISGLLKQQMRMQQENQDIFLSHKS